MAWQMRLMSKRCHAPSEEGMQIARLGPESALLVVGVVGEAGVMVGTVTVEERLRYSPVKLNVEDRRRSVAYIVLCTSMVGSTSSCVSSVGRGNSVCSKGHTRMSRSICIEFVLRCGFTHNFNSYITLAKLTTFQLGGTGCKSATNGTLIFSGTSNSKAHSCGFGDTL